MKTLALRGPGRTAWQDVPDPLVQDAVDVVSLADAVLPAACQVGAPNGGVRPGGTVLVGGAGPIGHAASPHSPGRVVVDLAEAWQAVGRLPSSLLITHRFEAGQTEGFHDVFSHAADTGAPEVALGGPQHNETIAPARP
ncbi:hypothetical protein ACWCXX_35145 [Streptomyces sp. NPDC001732]